MGLNIKKASTEAAIRELAAKTGESLTDAVESAVRDKLARVEQEAQPMKPAKTVEEFLKAMRPYQDRIAEARRRSGDTRSLQELMDGLYDEHGLPK